MDATTHLYISTTYSLHTIDEEGHVELEEQNDNAHPFRFVTGMGLTLDAFEEHLIRLQSGAAYDFTLTQAEAFGPYEEEHIVHIDKSVFTIDGKFAAQEVCPGNVIPLVNEDGNHFPGLVLEVGEKQVKIDLNHPYAGKSLHFKGTVLEARPATEEEIRKMIKSLSGEGCGCGCGEGGCHGDGGGCHCEEGGHHAGKDGCGCGEGGCGCGGHHKEK